MLDRSTALSFYKRGDVQDAILTLAKDREVAVRYGDKGFGKRPDILKYRRDVLEIALAGATSFHISEERWKNPLLLKPGMQRKEQDDLRIGWDLVIDIDCPCFEYSKDTAFLVIEWLKHSNICSISCKFSGNKGFHIGVPFEAFPSKLIGEDTRLTFPETPQRVAMYIHEKIKHHLADLILKRENGDIQKIMEKVHAKKQEDILQSDEKGTYANVEIDTVLISSRHLYRSALSFHEKSGLVSLPIDPNGVLSFDKTQAQPENIKTLTHRFLDPTNAETSECLIFFNQAFDFKPKKEEEEKSVKYKDIEALEEAIPEEFFPPCMKNILNGIRDGKKRAMFALTNFLKCVGWDSEGIEDLLKKWNEKNPERLRENILIGHLRHHKIKKAMLPQNCINSFYKDIKVCTPDNLCRKIKNPVQYTKRKRPKQS